MAGRGPVDTRSVLVVQPAVSPDAWSDIRDRSRPEDLMNLTRHTFDEGVELIIWPETALPVLESRDAPSEEYLRLAAFIDSVNVPLLTGAVIKERPEPSAPSRYYNSAVLFSPFFGIAGRYDKRIPVPFAERVPYIDRYPWLERLAVGSGGAEGYAAGARPGRLAYDDTEIGILICFESVFGRAVRGAFTDDLAYFVVLAQDGWWGDTAGYRQHYALTRLRAIESGRAVVQVTVTGITGLLLPDGSSQDETEWMERTGRRIDVPIYSGDTVYRRNGDVPVFLFALLLIVSGWIAQLRVSVSSRDPQTS
jgi:apolipoprotein N-acyltransferase